MRGFLIFFQILNFTFAGFRFENGPPPWRTGLVAQGENFTLNGDPIRILSGSIHYFRIPRDYWRDRIIKLRQMGFNTVQTYVAWNVHEETE